MIDVRNGNVVSDKPVEVKMLQGIDQRQPAGGVDFRRCHPFRGRRDHDAEPAIPPSQPAEQVTAASGVHSGVSVRRGHGRGRDGGVAVARCAAQQGPLNALQGFSKNRDQPVKIQAATLEVRDKDKVATFTGDVRW